VIVGLVDLVHQRTKVVRAIEEPQRPVERLLLWVIGGGNLIAHKDAGAFRLQCAAMPQVPHLGFLAVDQGFGKRVGRLSQAGVC